MTDPFKDLREALTCERCHDTGIDLPALLALRQQLVDWLPGETTHGSLWRAGLDPYAQATDLSLAFQTVSVSGQLYTYTNNGGRLVSLAPLPPGGTGPAAPAAPVATLASTPPLSHPFPIPAEPLGPRLESTVMTGRDGCPASARPVLPGG